MCSSFNRNKQKGISLVSLLIGAALGGFIITVIIQVFTTSRQVNKYTTNLTQLSEDSRFLVYFLNKVVGQEVSAQDAESTQ